MKKQYSEAQHSKAVAMYQAGIPVMDIAAQSGIPRSTLYSWIKSENDRDRKKSPTAKQLLDLERHNSRLEGMIQILKETGCGTSTPLQQRLAAAERLYSRYSHACSAKR